MSFTTINSPITITASTDYNRPLEITAEIKNDVAYFSIEGYINKWADTSSSKVREKIREFKAQGIKDAELYINSEGGSVFEAIEIDNLIFDNFGDYPVTVGALAASAATYFTSRRKTKANRNSQFMIHKPMMSVYGNQDKIRKDLKALDNMTDEYRETYMKKTGKSKEQINALWDGGDYWMTAKEAKKEKFINEIIDQDAKISPEAVKVIQACGAPIIPKAKIKEPKTINTNRQMDSKLIAVQLGLPEDATDSQINAELAKIKIQAQKASDLEANAKLQKEQAKSDGIKSVLDQAEKEKKITGITRPTYEAVLNADFENGKKVIDSLPVLEKLSAGLKLGAKHTDTGIEARKDWKYSDYQEKDPAAFDALLEKDPETANSLIEAYYGKDI